MATEVQPGTQPTAIPADLRAPEQRRPRGAAALHAPDAGHRGTGDDPVPAGQGARLLLRRVRPGGDLRRRRLRDGPARPSVHPAPRPRRAPRARRLRPTRILAQYMGRAGGVTDGREGNVHFGDRELGCVGHGLDAARHDARRRRAWRWPSRLRGEARCAITWVGDGATSRGDFHEAMNWAARPAAAGDLRAGEQPVRLLDAARACSSPSTRSSGRGRTGSRASASTATTSRPSSRRTRRARERALAGGGPTLIEARDDAHARPRRPRRHALRARRRCSRSGASATRSSASERRLAELGVDVEALREQVVRGDRRGAPQRRSRRRCPTRRRAREGVFCDGEPEPLGDGHGALERVREGARDA